jgi:hypothetical protein
MHSTDNLNDSYLGSGKYITNSINKHGRENFKREILEFFETRKLLVEKEKDYVNKTFLTNSLCMNLKPGGEGGFANVIHMMKCSAAGNKGFKEKLKTDSILSNKFQQLGSNTFKKLNAKGTSKGFRGKTHTNEYKKMLGEVNKIKQLGDKNSQFGTCWIFNFNLKENKKIKNDEIQKWIDSGWNKGRKNFINDEN